MRNKVSIITAALLLASTIAWAQQEGAAQTQPPVKQAQAPAATSNVPWLGSVDFGFRGTSVDGDEARYDRYSDLANGAYSRLVFGKHSDTFAFDASAFNVGYHNQAYSASLTNGKLQFSGDWNSTPLNYSYMSVTPWVEASSGATAAYTLDPAARLAVQTKTAIGIPANAAQLATPSIYRALARPFDMSQRRDMGGLAMSYAATPDLGLNLSFSTTKKSGYMPWAASFAFNNANELPLPLDNRSNDMSVGAEWANRHGMVRVGWDASWFNNTYNDFVWDNPLRATDTTPYDPSGYSNGNGPAQGRMAMAPDSRMNTVSAMGLYKMPSRTTVNATLSLTSMKQNDTLIPWTINPSIANPTVYASFPELAHLPRTTADAEVRGMNALVNFNTRPNKYVAFNMRYRYNNHDNRTPAFDAVEYVRFDAVPEETGSETEAFDIKRRTMDVNGTFTLVPYTALRVGYSYDAFNRTGRAFSDMTDDIFRVSLDTTRSQYVTIRGIYEHTVRTGSGFSEEPIVEGGGQPTLRFYDEADRDRDRATLLFVLTPINAFDVTASFASGKDVYKGEGHEFGLLDNDNTAVNIGFSVNPNEKVSFGLNYGRDKYSSHQLSRNANPPPDLQFNDPARNWTLDNDETVNNFDLYLDLPKAVKDTDLSLIYNFSDSDNAFIHGGPRIVSLTAAGTFEAVPNVTNKWRRVTAEAKHFFATKVGLAVGWWYEKLDVSDFSTVDLTAGVPRIDYLGELYTGYGNRPYKGNTGFARLIYLF